VGTWNHRIIAVREEREDFFQIHEVHYDDDWQIEGWTENAVTVVGDSTDEIRMTLHHMLRCLDKPILIEQDGKLVKYEPRPPELKRPVSRRSTTQEKP
jgi:hypothetical protein